MKTLIRLLAPAIAAAAILPGCSNSGKYVDNSSAFQRIEYTRTYAFEKSAEDYGRPADLTFGCRVNMLMPTALFGHDINALQDSIMQRAFGKYGADHNKLIEEQMKERAADYGYTLADTVLPDTLTARMNYLACVDGFASVEGDVETLTPKVLSYATNVSEYSPGAAHGNYGISYINYDLETGKIIKLSDILTPEGIVEMPIRLRSTAEQMRDVIGRTDIDALPGGDNFYITASYELVFSYQPYEVASYAQGEIQIPIPAYMIADYLTPYGTQLLLN